MSNHLLRELFNPGEDYQRNFSGTEHIFTVKPTSSEAFINSTGYLRSLLIPFALLYLHTVKNTDNHTRSDNLVGAISGLVNNAISIRGENNEIMIRAAIDIGGQYFSS